MKKGFASIIIFGVMLAVLAIALQFFEYKYVIGGLSTDVYTLIVAGIFTVLGIWVGTRLLKQKNETKASSPGINQKKLKELKLNDREYEILQLISKGLTNQEIADQLFLALPTIKTHTSNLYSKLDVKNRTQAVHKAQALKLIE